MRPVKSEYNRPMSGRLLSLSALLATMIIASQNSQFAGDYSGMLGPVHVRLHLIAGSDGAITGTVDSPDQNLTGVPCSNIRVEGQALSFGVPIVHGTWTGFLASDGNSLSGMWNQGSPVALTFTRIASAGPGTSVTEVSSAPVTGTGEVRWDDYIFKFDQSGTTAQVFEGGKIVGTILTINGQQRVLPLPGTDAAKLQRSFEDYKAFAARAHSNSTPPENAAAVPGAPVAGTSPVSQPGSALGLQNSGKADPSGIRFDDSNHEVIVPRTDGMTVTFAGQDVRISGTLGQGFILRRQKGSAGRFLERTFDHRYDAAGSLSGGGIEFLHASGGLIYDSGMGGMNLQENSQVRTAKELSLIAVDAVAAVRTIKGHENFTPPGYNTMKEISQYRLRSDGSR